MRINCTTCGGGGTPRYQGDYDAITAIDNQSLMVWTDFRAGSFGSYVGFFPDYAMLVSPAVDTVGNEQDSVFYNVSVPSVKLYNSNVIFSATVTPTPANGTITVDFPAGNTLSTFPGNVAMRVRTAGNVTLGNYTITITGNGPNGTPVHKRTVTLEVVLPTFDFAVNFLVSDNCTNSINLVFGTAPSATECFDAGLDQLAPPPPPAGAFDGRFTSCNFGMFNDFKTTNPDDVRIWELYYQPAQSCSPVSFTWDPNQLPLDGNFHLVDPFTGTMVNVNMRTTNNFTDNLNLGHLQIKFNYELCSNFAINAGWNMLSLPLIVSDSNYLTLFPNANPGTLFGYSNEYFSSETVGSCSGYWLNFIAPETVEVCGSDRTECTINLNAGWNMIGGPNCNIPLGSISDPGGIIIPGTIYEYSDGYFSATSIDATKAYWVNTNAAGTITLNCGTQQAEQINKSTIPIEPLADFIKIDINDAGNRTQTLYFDGKLGENISLEQFSLPPVPPQGSFDARLTGGYRLSESKEVTIEVQSSEYPLIISATGLISKSGLSYILCEIVDGVEVGTHNLVDGERIVIGNENVSILKVSKRQSIPTSFQLEQNYPNPFNPSTTIKYSVPEISFINLSVYNLLGERVAELVNKTLGAGEYKTDFDATELPSGVYFAKLESGNHKQTIKMILTK